MKIILIIAILALTSCDYDYTDESAVVSQISAYNIDGYKYKVFVSDNQPGIIVIYTNTEYKIGDKLFKP